MKSKLALLSMLVIAGAGCGGDASPASSAGKPQAPNAAAQPPKAPAAFTSKEGNFQVDAPAALVDNPQTQRTPAGSMTTHNYVHVDGEKTSRSVSYSDIPGNIPLDATRADAMLESGIKGMGRTWGIKGKNAVDLDGHPACDVQFDVPAPPKGEVGKGLCRLILADHRMYQVIIVGPASKMNDAAMKAYVESFKLLKPVKAIPKGAEVAAVPPPTGASTMPPSGSPDAAKGQPAPAGTAKDEAMPARTVTGETKPAPSEPADGKVPTTASVVEFRWLDADRDVVGGHGDASVPDGSKDQHLKLDLDLPKDTVIDSMTITEGGGNKWVTKPTPGLWPIAVHRNGEPITKTHAERIGTFSGKTKLDLFLNTGFEIRPGAEFILTVVIEVKGEQHTLNSQCTRP